MLGQCQHLVRKPDWQCPFHHQVDQKALEGSHALPNSAQHMLGIDEYLFERKRIY